MVDVYTKHNTHLIDGLVNLSKDTQVQSVVDGFSGYKINHQVSAIDAILSWVTLHIYTPSTTKIYLPVRLLNGTGMPVLAGTPSNDPAATSGVIANAPAPLAPTPAPAQVADNTSSDMQLEFKSSNSFIIHNIPAGEQVVIYNSNGQIERSFISKGKSIKTKLKMGNHYSIKHRDKEIGIDL
ncbi:MAG: hypothetical protein IJ808_05480 [Muribaculaceae bacterium]|nr:hypothetical protein [Muribaculaceae bacterium]